MFLQKRKINGRIYTYIEHSFRIGNKITKASFILNKEKQEYNDRIIEKIALARATYFKENFDTYFTIEEIQNIDKEKLFYQIFYNVLTIKQKEEVMSEFRRLFLSNSMELEGSTITPQIAEDIDHKKKITLPESDVILYNNSQRILFKLMHQQFRSVSQFKELHKELYTNIYPHAAMFKTSTNTFGYTDKATTVQPHNVHKELKNLLQNYKNKQYPFLKPLLFHLHYQKIHPFTDGNSRLGRLLLVTQMKKLGYPPLMFRGDMNFQIREILVEYCNHQHLDFCRLAMDQYLETSQKFWRPMIQRFLY